MFHDISSMPNQQFIISEIEKLLIEVANNELYFVLEFDNHFVHNTAGIPSLKSFLSDVGNMIMSNSDISKWCLGIDIANEVNIYTGSNYKSNVCDNIASVDEIVGEIKSSNPDILVTTSTYKISSLFSYWHLLETQIDYYSAHLYPRKQNNYNPSYAINELFWLSKHCSMPFMIQETGFSTHPNDGSSGGWGSYADQKSFHENMLQNTLNSGSIGYLWWQYMDIDWGMTNNNRFHGLYDLSGAPKPITTAFNISSAYSFATISQPQSYYTYNQDQQGSYFTVTLSDCSGMSLTSAVVRFDDLTHSTKTFVDEYGTATVVFNGTPTQILASAPGYESTLILPLKNTYHYNICLNKLSCSSQASSGLQSNKMESESISSVYQSRDSQKLIIPNKWQNITIYNNLGQVMYKNISPTSQETTINISTWPKGVYIVLADSHISKIVLR